VDAIGGGPEATQAVLERLRRTRDNKEFLSTLNKDIL